MSLNRKLIIAVLLFFSPLCLTGQTAYQGRLVVADPSFSLSGGKLEVGMEVNYEGLDLPSGESLTLTPVLVSGTDHLELPAILINGPARQKVYDRARVMKKRDRSSPLVVIKAGCRDKRHFRYGASVPFREWMSGSTLLLRTGECDCNGRSGHVYTDSIVSGVLLPRVTAPGLEKDVDARCLSWVDFLALPSDGDNPVAPGCPESGITLGGLFSLAGFYRPGSAEFNDLYDLAARLFPENSLANINAAAVALSRRDTRKARGYLSRFSTLPEAFNNMGVLCMLEGNREKAEVYLEMAVSHGVQRSAAVLKELHKERIHY